MCFSKSEIQVLFMYVTSVDATVVTFSREINEGCTHVVVDGGWRHADIGEAFFGQNDSDRRSFLIRFR